MAVSNDVIFGTVVDLMNWLEVFFTDDHPAWNKIWKNLDQRQTGGEYAAFDVVTNGPSTGAVQVISGNEAYSYSTRQMLSQGKVYLPEIIYPYAIIGKDLRRSSGPNGVINIVKKYPELGLSDFQQETTFQFVSGAANLSGLEGIVTLNGDETYSPDGTSLSGVLDFAAKASQSDTVFGLVKEGGASGVTGWYNQYNTVTNFSTHGRKRIFSTYNACRQRGAKYGPPNIGLCDTDTFENLYFALDDQVRYATKFRGQEGNDAVDGLMFLKMEVIADTAIDDWEATQFASKEGLMMLLNTKTWYALRLGGGKQDGFDPTPGNFSPRTINQIPGQDAFGHEFITAIQPSCRMLKANGIMDGTANT